MTKAQWALVLFALITSGARAQQATPVAQPTHTESETTFIAPYKPMPLSLDEQLRTCPSRIEIHPEVDGIYKVGGAVKAPTATNQVDAKLSDEARKTIKEMHLKSFDATTSVSMVVDPEGNPQVVCVLKRAGLGLDEQAVKTAMLYRFQPATKDGVPVAVRISVEIHFRRY